MENRWVTLVAATTENPFFSVISPLLSRSLLLRLESLTDDDIRAVDAPGARRRARAGRPVRRRGRRAATHLVRLAGGDARRSLTYLEAATRAAVSTSPRGSNGSGPDAPIVVDLATAELAVDQAAVRYDRQGDQHYDVTSAFIKSVRGSDADAALHYLARMIVAGEDPRFIARRLLILASRGHRARRPAGPADRGRGGADRAADRDARGAADPRARHHRPGGGAEVQRGHDGDRSRRSPTSRPARSARCRPHLRDAHYGGAKDLGHGKGYKYSHDEPYGIAEQQYAPDVVADAAYYRPTALGAEGPIKERWERVRRMIRGRHRG